MRINNLNQTHSHFTHLFLNNDIILDLDGICKSLFSLEYLHLSCKNLKILKHLPQELPHLKQIILKCPELISLEFMPQNLPKLAHLEIGSEKLESLKKLPDELPHLKHLIFICPKLKTLEFMPQSLPKLGRLEIRSEKLKSLEYLPHSLELLRNLQLTCKDLKTYEHLPKKFPNLYLLSINSNKLESNPHLLDLPKLERLSISVSDLKSFNAPKLRYLTINNMNLTSLEGLHQIMPNLSKISFRHCIISSLHGLPVKTAEFFNIVFDYCKIHSFDGISLESVSLKDFTYINPKCSGLNPEVLRISECDIYSFEGFPDMKPDQKLEIQKSVIYSFTGLDYNSLYNVLLAIYGALGSSRADLSNKIEISEKGAKLLNNCLNKPLFDMYNSDGWFLPYDIWYNLKTNPHLNNDDFEDMVEFLSEEQIKEREEKRFIPKNVEILFNYYKKNSVELAYEYSENPESLSKDELERLLYEADHRVLKVLETSVPKNDPILNKVIEKFSFEMKNGFKII